MQHRRRLRRQRLLPEVPSLGRTASCLHHYNAKKFDNIDGTSHGNLVRYGDSPTNPQPLSIALGESFSSGPWAGVGTNGGANIAIFTNSCGMRFRIRTQDQNRFFAGVHEVMMNMPVGNVHGGTSASFADTAQWSARGSTLSNLILTNVSAPASSAWLTPTMTNNSYGSYGGATTAGANIVAAWDTSGAAVNSRLGGETWFQSEADVRDAVSAAAGGYWYTCNFSNCSSYAL